MYLLLSLLIKKEQKLIQYCYKNFVTELRCILFINKTKIGFLIKKVVNNCILIYIYIT